MTATHLRSAVDEVTCTMPAMLLLFAIISPVLLLDLLATIFGFDSRDGFRDDHDRPGIR